MHEHGRAPQEEGRPEDGGVWTAKTVKRPPQQPAHPQYAKYWAPLTRKRHILPRRAQPRHTNYWAPRTRKRHQQEHRPQRPTERGDPTQHAKGRPGDCPGPRKGTTTRRNVTQGVPLPRRGPPPPPLPMIEADSQNVASAPSVPRGFKLQNFLARLWRGPQGDARKRSVPANPPPPLQTPPSDPPPPSPPPF